ncbi:immunoglobulin-like domain-containing protein [Alkalicoccus luteus]|uniref:immunoglobulin-like domain-containing protein n=1 Tax=Alkalicoccus luteus TaxID=1237094 RepID=UPI004034E0F9
MRKAGFGMVLLLAACGSGELSAETEWEEGHGELPEAIESEFAHEEDILACLRENDLNHGADFGGVPEPKKLTGEWFLHDGAGIFGYGWPHGTMPSGTAYEVVLFEHEAESVDVDRELELKVMDYSSCEAGETIVQERIGIGSFDQKKTFFSGEIPGPDGMLYLSELSVLHPDTRETEDTLSGFILTTPNEIGAALSYENDAMILKNTGPVPLVTGSNYTVEKRVNDTWRTVPTEQAFTNEAIVIGIGESVEEPVELPELTAGEYRLVKQVHPDGFTDEGILAVPFEVERP